MRPLSKQEPQEKKIGSIYVPVTARHHMDVQEGIVEAAGSGTKEVVMEVQVGDKILFKNGDSRITVDGCVLIDQNEVLFIL